MQTKADLRQFGEQLLKELMDCMDGFPDLFVQKSPCAKHRDCEDPWCEVFPRRSGQDGDQEVAEFMMAGTSCQDWSSMGTGKNLAGHTVLPFSIELQLVKRPRDLCCRRRHQIKSYFSILCVACCVTVLPFFMKRATIPCQILAPCKEETSGVLSRMY